MGKTKNLPLRRPAPILLLLWAATAAFSHGVITTVAGTDLVFPSRPLPPLNAPVGFVEAVAVDAKGDVYFSDVTNSLILRTDRQGILTVAAGNGARGFSGDGGPATGASLDSPGGIAVDGLGNVFIADTNNSRIRKVSPNGMISTIAGDGSPGFSGDGGSATLASLNHPRGLSIDRAGNLFVADADNNRIRKISPNGTISTVAGNGIANLSGDGGPATSASLRSPYGVAVDSVGNLFIADTNSARVRK